MLLIVCTPPASTTSCVPLMTACAAKCTACCELPHCRSTVVPGTESGMPQYKAAEGAAIALNKLTPGKLSEDDVAASLAAAYGQEQRPTETVAYIAGNPIPGDPGEGAGEKRKLPPPLSPEAGGAPPDWVAPPPAV